LASGGNGDTPAAGGNGAGNKIEVSAQASSGNRDSAANTRNDNNKEVDGNRRDGAVEKANSTTADSKPATVKPASAAPDAGAVKPEI